MWVLTVRIAKDYNFYSKSRIKANIPVFPRLNSQINGKKISLNFLVSIQINDAFVIINKVTRKRRFLDKSKNNQVK